MGSWGILPLLGLLSCWTYLPPLSADMGICILPADGGLCFILQERWYYDLEKKKCLPFSWGGCGGNENNFESRKECETACGRYDKPGTCPNRFSFGSSITFLGVCSSNCFKDADCKGNLKCCVNGCGQWTCTKPDP